MYEYLGENRALPHQFRFFMAKPFIVHTCERVSGKRNIILETQLPKGMETMQKIADLENLGIKPIMPGETEEVSGPNKHVSKFSQGRLVWCRFRTSK